MVFKLRWLAHLMRRLAGIALCLLSAIAAASVQQAAPAGSPGIVVFAEPGFPAADAAAPSVDELRAIFPDALLASASNLPAALAGPDARILVLPYGSSFPEADWEPISAFLDRGGSLLAIGGRPFLRAAYRDAGAWRLRPARNGFAETLRISYYEDTPGSNGLEFVANDQFAFLHLARFEWTRAFSPVLRLSEKMVYPRGGSSGTLDARVDTLAWGMQQGRRLAAPVVEIDHLRNRFAGGRWILLPCELSPGFYTSPAARELLRALAARALEGAEEFVVQPAMPLFLPDEPATVRVRWTRPASAALATARVEVSVAADGKGTPLTRTVDLPAGASPVEAQMELPVTDKRGFYTVIARLMVGDELRETYRTGFWFRDHALLRSGPRITVNQDYFERDGEPLAVAGTTYMASDVQRLFLAQPNPYVWDRDLAEIRAAGLNMLRTGLWSGWDQAMPQPGVASEFFLRSLEAFLLTARRHDLPVQFTFFAFMPEVFGGENPYLDPEAVRREKEYVAAIAGRFHDVPWLMWDLINEPSFDSPPKVWSTRPNGDRYEAAAWKDWLARRYPDRAAFEAAWNIASSSADPPLPSDADFALPNVYRAANHLAAHDFHIFAQEQFAGWAAGMRDAIRATGSRQLVTVGEDEGGVRDRPNPAFFASAVDFTAMHMWWGTDSILWDALVAKQPGLPMLAQEIGVNHDMDVDGVARRTPEEKAGLLERKLAVSLGAGAGAIQWLWNVNGYMVEPVEISIGAVRVDGTERPEAKVLRDFAAFARAVQPHLRRPAAPDVAILTSQAFQYSSFTSIAVEAQQKAVRALSYACGIPASIVAENQVARLGAPKLVVVPSPQALGDEAWRRLLAYVEAGGHALITGSMERDEHWQPTACLADLGLDAAREPIMLRQASLALGARTIAVGYSQENQQHFDRLRFHDGRTLAEVARGKGKLWIAAEPVELAEGLEPTVSVYTEILRRAGIAPPFTGKPASPGVLIRAVVLADAVLYLFVSESSDREAIDLRDKLTGARLHFKLLPGRARLLLLDKKDGSVLAEYGR